MDMQLIVLDLEWNQPTSYQSAAYRRVGEQVQAGTYRPTREVRHTHEGSIGNLCNDRIRAKMERVMERFE